MRLIPNRSMMMVGAGHDGGRAAQALREAGRVGPIMQVGAEPHLPYERPLLPKAPRTGESSAAQYALHRPVAYAAESIAHFVSRVDASKAAAHEITLADGSVLLADTAVAGVGIVPSISLALTAGLATARGVLVNAELQTTAAANFAAGDVAEFPSALSVQPIRQETWQNAETPARTAARNMLGGNEAYTELPWFWSDQYHHQLQVAGELALVQTCAARALGEGAELDFDLDADVTLVGVSVFGTLSAMAKELTLAALLLERRARPALASLANAGAKLKSLLSARNRKKP